MNHISAERLRELETEEITSEEHAHLLTCDDCMETLLFLEESSWQPKLADENLA